MDNFIENFIKSLLGCSVIVGILIFGIGLYFLPTLIAIIMHNHNVVPIMLLNLFVGCTGLGWLGALIWAVII